MLILHAIEDKTFIKNPSIVIRIPSHKELLIHGCRKTEIRILSEIFELHTELMNRLTIHGLPLNMSLTKNFTAIRQIRTQKKFLLFADIVQNGD